MKKRRLTTAFALSLLPLGLALPAQGSPAGESAKEVVSRSTMMAPQEDSSVTSSAFDLRKSSIARKHAYAVDAFWEELAQCETAQNWQNGGRYAGGLGIMTSGKFGSSSMGTWERFGGEEFAPSPDRATKEEQIIVANRISVEGWKTIVHRDPERAKIMGVPVTYEWNQRAVGFGGWGCYKSKSTGKYRMAKPKLFYYENHEDVVLFSFKFGEKSKAVHDLQVVLGVRVDSHYGPKTKQAHIRFLKKKRLPLSGVPGMGHMADVVQQASYPKATPTKRCASWEQMLEANGLPVQEFSYIMWRESRCKSDVIGWNYKDGMSKRYCDRKAPVEKYKRCKAVSSYDSGLLQINSTWVTVTQNVCKSKRGDLSVLLQPRCNLAVAKYLYDNGGMAHWSATSGRG